MAGIGNNIVSERWKEILTNMFGKRPPKTNRRIEPAQSGGWRERINGRLIVMAALGVTLCGLAAWSWVRLDDPRTLPITAVKVEGQLHHLSAQQLQQAAAAYTAGGFFNVDVDAVRDAVLRLPWVHAVSVRRVWPDTLQIAVVEHLPMARWGSGGLINSHGALFFPPAASYPAGLPELQGPQGSETVVAARYRDMDKTLKPLALHVSRVSLDDRRSWRIELDNGTLLVVLGHVADDARLTRFARIYPIALAARAADIGEVDLRYTNGFAVRWKKV